MNAQRLGASRVLWSAPDSRSEGSLMSFLKQPFRLRVVSFSAASLLCVMLASVMAPNEASNALVKPGRSVELQASKTSLTLPCPPGAYSNSRSCPSTADPQVALTAITKAFNKQPVYLYTVTGGRVVGEGSRVSWDLSDVGPGIYTATVEVQDNKKHRAVSSVIVTLQNCGDCIHHEPCMLPIVVTCYDQVKAGTPVTCTVKVRPISDLITYEWSARDSNGEDLSGRISGRGTSISIRTDGLGGQHLTTTVKVKGLDPSCNDTAVGSTAVKP